MGCQALIAGTAARGHTEACRDRMNKAMEETEEGRVRLEHQNEKENTVLARNAETGLPPSTHPEVTQLNQKVGCLAGFH